MHTNNVASIHHLESGGPNKRQNVKGRKGNEKKYRDEVCKSKKDSGPFEIQR
jgi:hypothetical protein